jgi:LemA protein
MAGRKSYRFAAFFFWSTDMESIIVGVLLALFVLSWAVGAYKRLLVQQQQVRQAFTRLDGPLKQRHEQLPVLVETARAYIEDERELLEAVIVARNQAQEALALPLMSPFSRDAVSRLAVAEGDLDIALAKLFTACRSKGNLAVNGPLAALVDQVAALNTQIGFLRDAYNDSVQHYNVLRGLFPGVLVAIVFAFTTAAPMGLVQVRRNQV